MIGDGVRAVKSLCAPNRSAWANTSLTLLRVQRLVVQQLPLRWHQGVKSSWMLPGGGPQNHCASRLAQGRRALTRCGFEIKRCVNRTWSRYRAFASKHFAKNVLLAFCVAVSIPHVRIFLLISMLKEEVFPTPVANQGQWNVVLTCHYHGQTKATCHVKITVLHPKAPYW